MANEEEMEEVSIAKLLDDIAPPPVLYERDETGRWIYNPAFTTAPRYGRLTYDSPPSEAGTSYVYSTGSHTWIEKPIT